MFFKLITFRDRSLNHYLAFGLFLALCLPFHVLAAFGADISDHQVPLPVNETLPLVTQWGLSQGIVLRALSQDMGRYLLQPGDAEKKWSILLTPQSALMTRVSVLSEAEIDPQQLDSLWQYLERATATEDAQRTSNMMIPPEVLTEIEAVVCVEAIVDGRQIQFSGFIVDPSGLVLCSAHDLKGVRNVRVLLFDGQRVKGIVVRRDTRRDLLLLATGVRSDVTVSLKNARNLIGMGERLFSVGCPARLNGTVHSGFMNGPPRRTGGLVLWQVQMEIMPGSSGSPVFDTAGRLVGMVKGRLRGTDSIGFLIPMETIMAFLKER